MIRNSSRIYLQLFISLVILMASGISYAQSPLANGTWAKFEIPAEGIYRISYEQLEDAGVAPSSTQHAVILGMPGGTLPQRNDAIYPEYLEPLPYRISSSDGSFGPGDFLYFYAESAHTTSLMQDELLYDHNNYSNLNYVFIGTGTGDAANVNPRSPVSGGGTEIRRYTAIQFHEETLNNLLSSGRNWYGERFDALTNQSFNFNFAQPVPGGEVQVTSKVMAQSFGTAQFSLLLNGSPLGEQTIPAVPDFLNPPVNNRYRYAVKGIERIDTFSATGSGENELTITLDYQKAGSRSIGYLDYLIVEAESTLDFEGEQIIIQSRELSAAGSYVVRVANAGAQAEFWDITSSMNPLMISDLQSQGEDITFGVNGKDKAKYAVFNPEQLPTPEFVSARTYPDILSANPDFIIVTAEPFASEANRLAQFRASHDGLRVTVVESEMLFDLMASGRKDPSAIRNYARHLYRKGALKYLLLMGKGSYDYYGVLPFFSNYIPTYQSRNSLDPLDTYASDDYYGFMEDDEGEWAEVSGGNHTMEIGVGRIPATDTDQAKAAVEKLIAYSSSNESVGSWRSRLLFVADDEDANLHHRQSDQLAVLVDTTETTYLNKRVFLGSFPQESGGGGESSPEASETLMREIQRGALIVNYTGHGNENTWTQEGILTSGMISSWQNFQRLPVFVTATCEFGRHDDPRQISGGERIITEPTGGGIGILTTGRPVFASSNFNLNKAFFNSFFEKQDGAYGRLGDIMRLTKNRSVDLATDVNKVGNRNFTLLGDPSLMPAFPQRSIEITSIEVNGVPSDTIGAGDKVVIRGEVSPAAMSGVATISVRDKEVALQTLDAPRYTYNERVNALYQGSATITNGQFSSEFIVPLNISNRDGYGRIYVYGQEENGLQDGSGAFSEVVFSGRSASGITDSEGPEIAVFFGDSTTTSRTDISTNTLLYIRLEDESGINTSGFGVGNNLTAVLDDNQTYILNDFYKSDIDNFQKGWAVFPINDLEPGDHRVTITARDVFNNSNQLSVSFEVADEGLLIIKSLRNYPNPVKSSTTFSFTHNRPGDNLDIIFTLIDTRGDILAKTTMTVPNSRASVNLPFWENLLQTKFLTSGVYIYGVEVRSTRDGARALKYGKLMLLN